MATDWRKFAEMVPTRHREYAVKEAGKTAQQRGDLEKKKPTAERMDVMRGKKPTAEDLALRDHDVAVEKTFADRREAQKERKKKKQRSRRGRRADAWKERGDKIRVRAVAHLEKYKGRLIQLGQWDAAPLGVPPGVWRACQLIVEDDTGHCARVYLAQTPPMFARRVKKAALNPLPYQAKRKRRGIELRLAKKKRLGGVRRNWAEDGTRHWHALAARRTVALGVAIWMLSSRTNRKGFKRVTRGFARKMYCAFVQDSNTGARPNMTTLYGSSNEVPGDIRALEQAGVLHTNQPPGDKVKACDKGPSGHAFNVHWVIGADRARVHDDDELAHLAAPGLLAELGLVDDDARAPPLAA